ncbi:hypothetical protein, partial [Mitsuokella jalaludinii]|uniref:hypothetical protein n=1 Tax=Mitsuokella jalaludinii TaxID=187979 RepID=UPI00307CAC3B
LRVLWRVAMQEKTSMVQHSFSIDEYQVTGLYHDSFSTTDAQIPAHRPHKKTPDHQPAQSAKAIRRSFLMRMYV